MTSAEDAIVLFPNVAETAEAQIRDYLSYVYPGWFVCSAGQSIAGRRFRQVLIIGEIRPEYLNWFVDDVSTRLIPKAPPYLFATYSVQHVNLGGIKLLLDLQFNPNNHCTILPKVDEVRFAPIGSLNPMYVGEFSNWADVVANFRITGAEAAEPDEVLYAEYEQEAYEGSAFVVYRRGETYYTVYGGHCSCYGLEDQWEPEAYTPELLVEAANKGNWWGPQERAYKKVIEVLG